jgi:hypothetical protein
VNEVEWGCGLTYGSCNGVCMRLWSLWDLTVGVRVECSASCYLMKRDHVVKKKVQALLCLSVLMVEATECLFHWLPWCYGNSKCGSLLWLLFYYIWFHVWSCWDIQLQPKVHIRYGRVKPVDKNSMD